MYLLFLAHPEGIEFKRLADYRDELTRYYMATAKLMDREKIVEGVEHLVNPLDNAINEKCSRIWYERLKVITLPRKLVISEI